MGEKKVMPYSVLVITIMNDAAYSLVPVKVSKNNTIPQKNVNQLSDNEVNSTQLIVSFIYGRAALCMIKPKNKRGRIKQRVEELKIRKMNKYRTKCDQ
jgi:hypothetical protein